LNKSIQPKKQKCFVRSDGTFSQISQTLNKETISTTKNYYHNKELEQQIS